MTTLCHCKDKICLPEICVFVVYGLNNKVQKVNIVPVVYVTSRSMISISVLSEVKYQRMCFMNCSWCLLICFTSDLRWHVFTHPWVGQLFWCLSHQTPSCSKRSATSCSGQRARRTRRSYILTDFNWGVRVMFVPAWPSATRWSGSFCRFGLPCGNWMSGIRGLGYLLASCTSCLHQESPKRANRHFCHPNVSPLTVKLISEKLISTDIHLSD